MASAMPDAGDLLQFLIGAGMAETASDTVNLGLEGAIAAAIADFERSTHWEPFVSSGSDVTLKYSPTDVLYPPDDLPMLDLGGGVLSVTSLTVGVTATSAGNALTLDTDYFLMPSKAPIKGKPYTYIHFYRANFAAYGYMGASVPNSIRLVGKAGYSFTCPDDAYRAVLKMAALSVMPQLSAAKSGGLLSWSESDVKEQYAADAFGGIADRLKAEVDRVVKQYRRVI